jgi:DNA-binding transcriptional LysR family regulator
MNTPNWDDLRYFLALIDAGSLSGAARATDVEHTTVARRINALEAALETRLFDRFPKAWSLTTAGSALVPLARKIEDDMHGLMRVVSCSEVISGKVRISAPPALMTYWLARQLKSTVRRLPGIEMNLFAEAHESDLMRREADIALRYRRPSAPSLAVRLLTTVKYGLYASAEYLAERPPQHWEFLGYDEQLSDAPQQVWLDKIRGGRRYCLRSNDLGTLFQAAATGCGVAVLPDYFFGGQRSDLIPVDTEMCPVKRKLWLVMHEDVRRSAAVRAVADEILTLFLPMNI